MMKGLEDSDEHVSRMFERHCQKVQAWENQKRRS